jgi:4-amino-4-deoxy-L-arabinose transferase-like glycosyltransferase
VTTAHPPLRPSVLAGAASLATDPWWRRTLLLVLGVTLARVLYLVFLCPYTLIEDEAHYWEWSRRLEWSYYTKGPGVAWSIAAATRLLGDHEFAVRLPAALGAGLATLLVALLARDAYRSARVGFLAACCVLLCPIFQVLGLVMTIDSPYAACWAMAMWSAWRAFEGRGRRWFALAGLAMGVGLLYKYTILLAIPGLALAAWRINRDRPGAVRASSLPFLIVPFVVGILPVIIWNAREGWPTVAHLLGHLGVKGGDMPVTQGGGSGFHYDPTWTLQLVATQLGMVGPILALAAAQAIGWMRGRVAPGAAPGAERFLVLNSAPILIFYLLVSVVTEPEGNWPLAGYLTLLPMAAARVAAACDAMRANANGTPTGSGRRPHHAAPMFAWRAAIVIGAATALMLPRLDLLARLPVVGPLIPVHRFMGADRMAADVAGRLDALRARTGLEPFVVSSHYGRASQMAFYLPGRPTTYCTSDLLGPGRRTQYDYWADTDLRRQTSLSGRPAVALGADEASWRKCFVQVTPASPLDGDGKRGRAVHESEGFTGFSTEPGVGR